MNKSAISAGIGLVLFCIGYLLINERILVQSILYRTAASDFHSASIAFAAMALQATVLLTGLILLTKKLFWLMLFLLALSAGTNVIFSQILNDIIDLARFDWMLTEVRHAKNAAGEFMIPAAIGIFRTFLALCLFVASRKLIRRALTLHARLPRAGLGNVVAVLMLVTTSLAFGLGLPGPVAAERNIYNFAAEKMITPPPPDRGRIKLPDPEVGRSIEKIVWIIDESVGYDVFARLVSPGLSAFNPVDFGKTSAMANCSAPSHVALRSGVDVNNINHRSDLRATPSIWAYAQKSGYKTILIEGQTSGPPQNLLFSPEAGKIDQTLFLASGMETDLAIAKRLNDLLKTPGRKFVYTILRGVHFQYSDHYPAGTLPDNSPVVQKYDAAVAYSKRGFFKALLHGIDREKIAIVYTSDHGQNLEQGAVPHCSMIPARDEFAVPLLAFLPQALTREFPGPKKNWHSASQIFPTTLKWMGYDQALVTQTYDNMLDQPTKNFVWFGRAVIPLRPGDKIEVTTSSTSLAD